MNYCFLLLSLFVIASGASNSLGDAGKTETFDLSLSGTKYVVSTKTGEGQNSGVQTFSVQGKKHEIGPIWTVFALVNSTSYKVPTWKLSSHCGYWEQECGDQCDATEDCVEHNFGGGILNVITMSNTNWCHRLTETSQILYQRYRLHPSWHVALTTWGGYLQGSSSEVVSPGWTITSSEGLIDYTKNAQIVKMVPHSTTLKNLSLSEKEGMVADKYLLHLAQRPKFKVNLTTGDCWNHTIGHTLIYQQYNTSEAKKDVAKKKTTDTTKETLFTPTFYSIFQKGKSTLQGLDNEILLTNDGPKRFVAELVTKTPFPFFDPCNMQFLTLTLEQEDIYSVAPISGQASHDFYCVALLNTNNSKQYNFHLYEFTSDSKSFKPSNKFIGALSPDYIAKYELQITDTTNTIPWPPSSKLILTFQHTSAEKKAGTFEIHYKSTLPSKCKIALSGKKSEISKTLTFSKANEVIVRKYTFNELPFSHIGYYDCDGTSGTFFIPFNYTNIPGVVLDATTQEILAKLPPVAQGITDQPSQNQTSWRSFVRTLEYDLQVHHTIIAFMIFIVAICIFSLFWYFHKKSKT